MNSLNDTAIIEKVLRGNTEAFGGLVERYSEKIFSLVFRICGNREDAEEVAQDTFVKAYNSLRKFRSESSFSSWIYRIAYNTALSHLRKNKGVRHWELNEERFRAATEEEAPEGFGSVRGEREEQLQRLEKSLLRLSPDDRALMVFFYHEEKSIREVAAILSQSEGNIKLRLHRVRKKLAAIYHTL